MNDESHLDEGRTTSRQDLELERVLLADGVVEKVRALLVEGSHACPRRAHLMHAVVASVLEDCSDESLRELLRDGSRICQLSPKTGVALLKAYALRIHSGRSRVWETAVFLMKLAVVGLLLAALYAGKERFDKAIYTKGFLAGKEEGLWIGRKMLQVRLKEEAEQKAREAAKRANPGVAVGPLVRKGLEKGLQAGAQKFVASGALSLLGTAGALLGKLF